MCLSSFHLNTICCYGMNVFADTFNPLLGNDHLSVSDHFTALRSKGLKYVSSHLKVCIIT